MRAIKLILWAVTWTLMGVWLCLLVFRVGVIKEGRKIIRTPPDIVVSSDYLSEWQLMVLSISYLETGGTYNADAKNPISSATGILQQLECIVYDCNRILGREVYLLDDRHDIVKCLEMFEIIQQNYNPDKDIHKGMRLHSTGFATENRYYTNRVYEIMRNIQNYEAFREKVLEICK